MNFPVNLIHNLCVVLYIFIKILIFFSLTHSLSLDDVYNEQEKLETMTIFKWRKNQ